jgi:nicotinamide-nucleotide amidase
MKHAEAGKLKKTSRNLANVLCEQELTLAVAESCTGGWIAKCCTDIAGSSSWFDRGFITYSNAAKIDMLAVEQTSLANYGAVSEQVAIEMAQGALKHSHADLTIAVTGIAGPDGGSEEKPVGTVWIAWASKSDVKASLYHFDGDREHVRFQTVITAMDGVIKNARDSALTVG